jgi:hypothetical protein
MIAGMKLVSILIAALVFLVGATLFSQRQPSNQQHPAASQVPFVGCASDGQVGPLNAPAGERKRVSISPSAAARLAYYKAENGFVILGPRGWYCFSTYGSSGSTLYVAPETIDAATLFSSGWKGFSGQVIQASVAIGDTSGRFAVARTIARVFPDYKAFVQDVIAEGIAPSSSFPVGPYPKDRLTYRSKNVVEFETPPNSTGLGTDSRLQRNGSPIVGVSILFGEVPSLLQVSTRLSEEDRDLVRFIVARAEREAAAYRN